MNIKWNLGLFVCILIFKNEKKNKSMILDIIAQSLKSNYQL